MLKGIRYLNEFVDYDYSLVFSNNAPSVAYFFHLFSHPLVPILSIFAYLYLSKPLFGFIRDHFKIQPKGKFMFYLTTFHSSLLAIYSAWTFFNSSRIIYPDVWKHGFFGSVCDYNGKLWNDGLGFWVTHFYISKYYEFVDSWFFFSFHYFYVDRFINKN
jgi:hypothetical protein